MYQAVNLTIGCGLLFITPAVVCWLIEVHDVIPAVDDHGTGLSILSLYSIDLSEEAEDTAGLLRDAVIRPAHVLVVRDLPTILRL